MTNETKWTLLAGGATVLAAVVARRALEKGWSWSGRTPPPEDPELGDVSRTEALIWSGLTAGAVGLARLGTRRLMAGVWRKSGRGTPPT